MIERPGTGDAFPPFALPTATGGSIRTSDLAGRPAVLFFFPKAMTPGCTDEAMAFSALKPRFDAAGVTLLGISRDPPERLGKFADKHGLTVDLASDLEEPSLSHALGIWGEKQLYGRRFLGLIRTTYLVGRDGRIERVWDKVRVKGHAEDVLAATETR